jgi:hypothetical protein
MRVVASGFEPPAPTEKHQENQDSGAGAAQIPAQPSPSAQLDAELGELVAAWPGLSRTVKAGILAMVRAALDRP